MSCSVSLDKTLLSRLHDQHFPRVPFGPPVSILVAARFAPCTIPSLRYSLRMCPMVPTQDGVFAISATADGFVSGGGRDGLVKLWSWQYDLFPVDDGENNIIDVGAGIRCIACIRTDDGFSLSQFLVGTLENSVCFADAESGVVDTIIQGHHGGSSAMHMELGVACERCQRPLRTPRCGWLLLYYASADAASAVPLHRSDCRRSGAPAGQRDHSYGGARRIG